MDPTCIKLAYKEHRCKELKCDGHTYERLIYEMLIYKRRRTMRLICKILTYKWLFWRT